MTKIPEWIIKYDQANYQSSAGKAVRELMGIVREYENSNNQKNELVIPDVISSAIPKLKSFAMSQFDTIAERCRRINTGNVAHDAKVIEGQAKRCSEFISKHY